MGGVLRFGHSNLEANINKINTIKNKRRWTNSKHTLLNLALLYQLTF